jgi:hypothetical protein
MGLLFVGDLDLIAPILTMFFLLTYCLANVACLVHAISGHPNWRPKFWFFTWHTALIGALICSATMIFLDWVYTCIALAFIVFLIYMISFNAAQLGKSWGNVSQSLIFELVSTYLLRLDSDEAHVKFWRPQFMVTVSGGPCGVVPALEFIDNMNKGGLFVIGDSVTFRGELDDRIFMQHRNRRRLWKTFIAEASFKAFSEIVLQQEGTQRLCTANLVGSTGIGGLKPNTLVQLLPDAVVAEDDLGTAGRARQKKLAVAANSVYKPGAPDGCLTTCAQHRDLWSSAAAGDQTYGDDLRRRRRSAMVAAARGDGAPPATASDSGGDGDGDTIAENNWEGGVSTAAYVGMLQDAVSARKHLVLLGAMAELQKHDIAGTITFLLYSKSVYTEISYRVLVFSFLTPLPPPERLGKFAPRNQTLFARKKRMQVLDPSLAVLYENPYRLC